MTSINTPEKTLFNLRRNIMVCLLLIVAIVAVYSQAPRLDFVNFDDDILVTDNPQVQLGLTSESIAWSFEFTPRAYWHPLTWLSHMLDYQVYGLNPGMHHLTNLILHLANSLLLFLVLNRMTGSLWKSSFVAALFALHPLNVESVAWVASRKNVLSTLFWMLTMLSYVYYCERPSLYRYLLTCLFFALGLMAKPMLVTLPFVLLLLDYWPLGRIRFGQIGGAVSKQTNRSLTYDHQRPRPLNLIVEKVPLLALAAVSIYLSSLSIQGYGILISTEAVPMKLRIANGLVSYISYIAKMLWPQSLAVYYPYPIMLPLWQTVGAGFFLVCASFLALWTARRLPYILIGWLWFLGTLIPVIGLLQWGLWPAMADRFAYVPMIGLFVIIAWGVPHLVAKWRYRTIFLALTAGTALAASMLLTWIQLHHWKNTVTLFQHALNVTANNYLAHNKLGNALAKQGKLKQAFAHYDNALRINPDYPYAHNNLGNALARQGKSEEAIAHYRKALQIKPDFPRVHNNLGNALARQGRNEEAIAHYRKAIEQKADFAGAHNNLGNVLEEEGQIKEAVLQYSKALQLEPDFAEAYFNMGNILVRQGKMDEAIDHFTKALQQQPDFAEAHNSLGVVLAYRGELDEAIVHFSEAVRLKPTFLQAQNNLRIALQEAQKLDQAKKDTQKP